MSCYPVELSCVKSVDRATEFNMGQLRLLINGGNRRALDFFRLYGMDQMSV